MAVAYRTRSAYTDYTYAQREEFDGEEQARLAARAAMHRRSTAVRRALVLFMALAAAAVCIGLLFVKSQIYLVQRDINATQQAITKAERLNSNLSEQYSEAVNVDKIMERAKSLGMQYPTGSQVLYVDLSGSGTVEMKK